MKEGKLQDQFGCVGFLWMLFFWALGAFIAVYNFQDLGLLVYLGLTGFVLFSYIKKKIQKTKGLREQANVKVGRNGVIFRMKKRKLVLNNPFRGIFVLGAAGSGKSESVAVP